MKQSEIIKMVTDVCRDSSVIRVVVPYWDGPRETIAVIGSRKIIIGRSFAGMKENGNIIDPWLFKAVHTNNQDQPILWCYGRHNTKYTNCLAELAKRVSLPVYGYNAPFRTEA